MWVLMMAGFGLFCLIMVMVTDWQEITNGLPVNKHVAKITASIYKPGRVYVVLNDRRAG